MSKNKSRQSASNYFLTVIVSATMGAAITWLIMSQSKRSTSTPPVGSPAQSFQSNVIANATSTNVSGMSPGDAAVALGNFAYDHQQWPEAIRHYQEAIASGVDNADVHTDLGNSFRFSGQPEQALNQYLIAQKLNPQHENSMYNQISLFTEVLKQPQRAVPICEEFVRRFPNSDKLPAVHEQLERAKAARP